ncbi:required for drug-induced death protein 1-like [Entelurus aequoreus]|uniref:required for drug-induced death protein 1-like n=1 Tax=Entelurus aequoreus TaxID=161455 RepID=UPI002B1D1A0C|nr:required for drug-induced death protein 1-like [Entelurus aequoreus]
MKPKGVPWRSLLPRDAEATPYQRHVDCCEEDRDSDESTVNCTETPGLGFKTGRYQPLIDQEKKKKKEKYKKVRKNVGKALRTTWKCFMLGLHNFAQAYSTPITLAATFQPRTK